MHVCFRWVSLGLALAGWVGGADAAPAEPASPLVAVLTWVEPKFPAEAPAAELKGRATVRLVVDEQGSLASARVLRAKSDAYGKAALAAVRQWTFSPALAEGRPVAQCVDIVVEMDRNAPAPRAMLPKVSAPRGVEVTPARKAEAPTGECPEKLVGRGLAGSVMFSCRVEADGRVSDVYIVSATHPDYIIPAFRARENWRFEPAKQGDLAVASTAVGEVFYLDPKPPPAGKTLMANGITAPDGSIAESAPTVAVMVDPVYPYERAIAGETGSAAVTFTVLPSGAVTDVSVRETTHPDFGEALAAAVRACRFEGAIAHGVKVSTPLLRRYEFKLSSSPDDAAPTPEHGMLARLQKGEIGSARNLDSPLGPLYRVKPVVPEGAATGKVSVEFVVDEQGRARWPRVIAAPSAELGWAAATAVSQWVFQPPLRAGKPNAVLARAPIVF